jgi:transposase
VQRSAGQALGKAPAPKYRRLEADLAAAGDAAVYCPPFSPLLSMIE